MQIRWTKFKNILSQVVAVAGTVYVQAGPYIPKEYKLPIQVGIAIVQGITAKKAHTTNEDGTPQEVAFQPPPDLLPKKD